MPTESETPTTIAQVPKKYPGFSDAQHTEDKINNELGKELLRKEIEAKKEEQKKVEVK